MKKERRKPSFLALPQYPGGKKAFAEFIGNNMVYPPKALELRVEGSVYLEIVVKDTGEVVQAKVRKGLGHGCDEEAIRLAMMLKYDKAKNRGVRVQSTVKAVITFKLPKPQTTTFNYTIAQTAPKQVPQTPPVKSYGYTIKF